MRSILHSYSWFLQPVPPWTDTPSLHMVFKPMHPSCYPVCVHTAAWIEHAREQRFT